MAVRSGLQSRVPALGRARLDDREGSDMNHAATRTDIQPVILGGDLSAYPLGREFFEEYGLTSICVAPEPIAVIGHSRFFDHHYVDNMHLATIREALVSIAREHSDQTVIVLGNWDAAVEMLEQMAPDLPENVICPIPPRAARLRAADKTEFARMCAEFGLHTPRTETVRLKGSEPIPPTEIPFPLVAKPAVSGDYSHLYLKGFQKVYFMHEQDELDRLWRDLRAEGFGGEFLVQELISGDDTYMDSITMYMDRAGEATLCASAQVLLEDHAPTLFGNPVAMITRPMPELWEKVAAMLRSIGWRGFANIDLKRDPQTGRAVFMDFNPRIGANSYYCAAAGVNPMRTLVEDYVDNAGSARAIERTVLYTRVPVSLTRRYLVDEALRAEYDALVKSGAVANPMRCPEDTAPSRFYGWLMAQNFVRKFNRYYPKPTETSF